MTQEYDLVGALMTMRIEMDKVIHERNILAQALSHHLDGEYCCDAKIYDEAKSISQRILEENKNV